MDSATRKVLAMANAAVPMSASEATSDVAANVIKTSGEVATKTFNPLQSGGAEYLKKASDARMALICENNSNKNWLDSFGCALHKLDDSPIFLGVMVVLLLMVYFGALRMPKIARRVLNHHAVMLVLFAVIGIALAFQQVKLALLLLVTFFILKNEFKEEKKERKEKKREKLVRFEEPAGMLDDNVCDEASLDSYDGGFVGSPIL